jgi:predicted metal-dependent phosphotriesterase family hydrolase
LITLVEKGFEEYILMSQDRVTSLHGFRPANAAVAAWIKEQEARGEWPLPFTYLFPGFIPLLQSKGLPIETIERILTDNLRRFFSGIALREQTSPRAVESVK